jgi:hypothetical protein
VPTNTATDIPEPTNTATDIPRGEAGPTNRTAGGQTHKFQAARKPAKE